MTLRDRYRVKCDSQNEDFLSSYCPTLYCSSHHDFDGVLIIGQDKECVSRFCCGHRNNDAEGTSDDWICRCLYQNTSMCKTSV